MGIIEEIRERHESLIDSIPPKTREAWKNSALSHPDSVDKDRYWLLEYITKLKSSLEEAYADLANSEW